MQLLELTTSYPKPPPPPSPPMLTLSIYALDLRGVVRAPQALSFDQHMPPEGAGDAWRREAAQFQRAAVHLASLLHGVALQHLRGDWDLDNLVEHDHHASPPVTVPPPPPRVA